MAKAKKSVDKGPDRVRSNGKEDIPEGFDEIVSSADRADGWAIKGEGVIVQGRLISRTVMRKVGRDGSRRAFYTLVLQRDCECTTGKGEEAKQVTLTKGDTVNVDESTALQDLEPRTRDGGVYDVWIKYGKQDPESQFWPAAIRLRVIKEPTREATVRENNVRRNREERDNIDYDYGRETRNRDD